MVWGMLLGMMAGVVLGAATGQMAVWLPAGLMLGWFAGVVAGRSRRNAPSHQRGDGEQGHQHRQGDQ